MVTDERIRLFVAFQLPEHVVDALAKWQDGLPRSPAVRIVPRPNLHVTIAFLGARPRRELGDIVATLPGAAAAAGPPVLEPVRYRETRSVGMVVCSDEDGRAAAIADAVFQGLEALGVYEREQRSWLPHVTVVRFRKRPRSDPPLPAIGPFAPSGVAVYMSKLRPTGAQYEVLESVRLGGR